MHISDRDQFSPSDSSITDGEPTTRRDNQKVEPGTDMNLHSNPHGSGILHSSEPSNEIETESTSGPLRVSGRNANLINVEELSKILALTDKTNRGLSSKSSEMFSSLINQLLSNAKAWPDGMFIYLRLWQMRGKRDADRFAQDHQLQPAINEWLAENRPAEI